MNYLDEYRKWLNSGALTESEKKELTDADDADLQSRFHGYLQFGTAGLRGIMGAGTNRMNVHVVRHATQAFAEVILGEGEKAKNAGVAVCFDCRNNSREFASAAACVLAANGIHVRLFESLRPTPELSFAVRQYGCIAGINVTASHNPKEYNGYKVYWSDGAQLPPHHAAAIAAKMAEIDLFRDIKTETFDKAVSDGMITFLGRETDELFLENVLAQASDRQAIAAVEDTFKLVYTPFHGTGYKLIPEMLKRLGLWHLYCVPEQMVIDGNFPTVASPNPENPEGFALAVKLADKVGADLILGSDPDADRIGILVRNPEGAFVPMTGNQVGVLMLDYVILSKMKAGTMPEKPAALKSIVTTEMAAKVAETNGIANYNTFTGFKFMAEKKNQLEESGAGKVIFSFEESYGYMVGDYVRDKDAVTAALVITEMAASYAGRGMTLYDAMQELYRKYGYYGEKTLNLVMPGLDGLEKMRKLMTGLRESPLTEIAGSGVLVRRDYADGVSTCVKTGKTEKMELSGSDVLGYDLSDGTKVIVRPSGTEPKIKVYVLTSGKDAEDCGARTRKYAEWAGSLSR